jgi:cytochrome P450
MTSTQPLVRPTTIPGPSGKPLLGMVPALRRDLLGTLLENFHRYGDVVAYRLGPRRGPHWLRRTVIAVHHPDGVHRVLTDGQVFVRRTPGFEALTDMFGKGLLTSDGETWLRQRRTLQPLFTPRRVAGYLELMTAEAERIMADPVVRPGAIVDLHQLMQRYTLHVVGRALFGDDVDDVVADLRHLVPLVGELALARTRQLPHLPMSWPTPLNRGFVRARTAQYAIVDRILDRRRAGGGDDLLSRLWAATDPETGQPISTQEIRDQVLVFLLAGHETTAGALTFTLHLLGRHPHIQEQVAAVATAPVDPRGGRDLIRTALLEGMRLFPPAHTTDRLAVSDTEISGHRIPAGTGVLVSAWVTHRHPQFWPDPEHFDPGRFAADQDRPRYAYFPFGGGPRSCIGEHFALLEGTVLLRTLLARYRVESLDPRLPLVPLITLRPTAPVRVRLTQH